MSCLLVRLVNALTNVNKWDIIVKCYPDFFQKHFFITFLCEWYFNPQNIPQKLYIPPKMYGSQHIYWTRFQSNYTWHGFYKGPDLWTRGWPKKHTVHIFQSLYIVKIIKPKIAHKEKSWKCH